VAAWSTTGPATEPGEEFSKGAILLAGQAEPAAESRALETWVLSKKDGTWRVEAFHNCPENAA
jgi:hypothetical protein